MEKKTLNDLFSKNLFQVPDYQRGYAWDKKQWNDFIQDIDALVNEEVKNHYAGTVVVYQEKSKPAKIYGIDRLETVDIVDGQQRLVTSCLYLSIIIRKLIEKGETAYEAKKSLFLFSETTCKLTLNNNANNYFYNLLNTGQSNTTPDTTHEKRLQSAYNYFKSHIEEKLADDTEGGVGYLRALYLAMTSKLVFTFYTIEEECEIGMTFELMNSRGKGLSVLELLKNYLMYWVSRNESDEVERASLTTIINNNWKDVYNNLGTCVGNEDQCLRTAWTLFCTHSPRNWIGYNGFKNDDCIPLKNFNIKSKEDTKKFIKDFSNNLGAISKHYAIITSPTSSNTISGDELIWLTKIHNTGNIANFLPLLVAARKHRESDKIIEENYISLLKALEIYAYRVFLYRGRRSDSGKSSFYRWGNEVLEKPQSLPGITESIHELTRYYASEDSFQSSNAQPSDWYGSRNRLKYTLYEYELHLLATEGQGKQPRLDWKDLKDSTIEHILPQNLMEGSHWKEVWKNPEDIKECLHDIGNLVLTKDNSKYSNFEFERKKGQPGQSPSYINSDIRQERKISQYDDWTRIEFDKRRNEIIQWINQRWKTKESPNVEDLIITDEDDVDGIETQVERIES